MQTKCFDFRVDVIVNVSAIATKGCLELILQEAEHCCPPCSLEGQIALCWEVWTLWLFMDLSQLLIKVVLLWTGREQKYEDGIALLRNALANQSDCVLHRILGDFLVAVNEYQEAMDQYSIALR